MSVKPLDRPEPIRLLLLRALLKRSEKNLNANESFATLPNTEHSAFYSQIRPAHIKEFHRVVSWPDQITEQIHPCYLHIYAFPQHLNLMLESDFPFSVLGIVHLQNRIEQFGKIDTNKVLEVSSRFGEIKPHPKGLSFSIKSSVRSIETEVWRSERSFLIRQPTINKSKAKLANEHANPNALYTGSSPWHFSPKTSRSYAKISGDYNPIHIHRLSAKLFGFKRAIAHGMWTLSCAVSAFVSHQEDSQSITVKEVNCRFKKPVFLPNDIHIQQHCKTDTSALLDVSDSDDSLVHLSASVAFNQCGI